MNIEKPVKDTPPASPEAPSGSVLGQVLDAAFKRWAPLNESEQVDWLGDIDRAYLYQRPLRTRTLLYVFGISVVALIVWSAFAELDEVTRGEGKVIPSRQVQIIQSIDGGEVSEIMIAEGDIVERNQLLVRLDKTRFMATFRESMVEREALEVKLERLRALSDDDDFMPSEALRNKVPNVVAMEKSLYESVKAEWASQTAIFNSQLAQRQQELAQAEARRAQLSRAYALVSSEIEYSRPLVPTGAVSKVDMLRLEREANRLAGERDQTLAQIAGVKEAIIEAREKTRQVKLDYLNKFKEELAQVAAKVEGMSEGQSGLSDRVDKTDIRSPVRGTVKRLYYNTLGGVVLPGKEVVEIVPLDDALLLETRILPKDIAFLRPGQKAVVKFTAYDYLIYGGMEGVIEQIGVDTVPDDKGNPFYIVRVRTDKANLAEDKPIIPGMVASVDIITGKKSVLTYLLKPILRGKEYALRER
ncbi:HlyD family type I secretion periplasmic adaptor subunit [Spongiibacter sp.]|uniref:HlyD family type I secretion periplasmic adaptor subunit n=1 Tax=Spongiibacter sp. TaxID=2024860 RepID=UPI00356A0465